MGLSARLRRRVEGDFPGSAAEVERRLLEANDSERVQAAIVLWAAGDRYRLEDSLRLAEIDWRDVLVRAELADEDWPGRLDAVLGSWDC